MALKCLGQVVGTASGAALYSLASGGTNPTTQAYVFAGYVTNRDSVQHKYSLSIGSNAPVYSGTNANLLYCKKPIAPGQTHVIMRNMALGYPVYPFGMHTDFSNIDTVDTLYVKAVDEDDSGMVEFSIYGIEQPMPSGYTTFLCTNIPTVLFADDTWNSTIGFPNNPGGARNFMQLCVCNLDTSSHTYRVGIRTGTNSSTPSDTNHSIVIRDSSIAPGETQEHIFTNVRLNCPGGNGQANSYDKIWIIDASGQVLTYTASYLDMTSGWIP